MDAAASGVHGSQDIKAPNYVTARTVQVVLPSAQQVELDGDDVGRATGFRTRVEPGALLIRVPVED